ncbi:MAG TPA: LysM peptidoglycan-binding domain-containing protein, partial [Myxococcales bacterium]|nr:LysM peptidoglycan-binding domain-containing protein [Myxococcales bacterium]
MNVTVKTGDTLSGIAQQHGAGLQGVINANPQLSNPNLIHTGDQIRVPGGSGGAPPAGAPGAATRPGGAAPAGGDGFSAAPASKGPVDLSGSRSNGASLDTARSLIGRGYGDINSATPVGRHSPEMN